MKNKPKVFLFGTNCASVLNNLTIGFEKTGVPVKTVSYDFKRSKYNNYSKINCICGDNDPGKFKQQFYKIKGLFMLIQHLLWCDVVHVYGNMSRTSFWVISKLAKHKYVTFVGSDIRMPDKELAINPYFKYAYQNEGYEYKIEATNNTPDLLKFLKGLGFMFIVWDMDMFLDRSIIGRAEIVPHASMNMEADRNLAQPGDPKKILVVHSPTAPVAKGTYYVLTAIEKLRSKNIFFEFKLLKHLPNEEYQRALREADIYVDQLIWGGYGVAAQQALQMGKVVVAYISPERIKMYGEEMPVQNATINNLEEVLEKLISSDDLRKKIGEQSETYYKKMHEPGKVATKMLAAYSVLMQP